MTAKYVYVTCVYCKYQMRQEFYDRHMKLEHRAESIVESQKNKSAKPEHITNKTSKKLLLISRRSKRVDIDINCSNCGVSHNPVWEYAESSRGRVYICHYCKPILVQRSFDVKLYRLANFGGFESGKKR